MRIIRKELAPTIVYPFPVQYDEETDTVEASFDGGTTYEPFPEGDPRQNNHTPPPDTADPRCDAAARISAGTQEVIEYVIAEIDLTSTVSTIVNGFIRLFTPLFTVIPYLSLVYTAINAILALGSGALHLAFDTFDWDEFTCLVYKNLQADGRLSPTGFEQLLTDIANEYDSTQELVLYQLYANAGYAGLNDQAGIRDETGDCASCPTTWTHVIKPSDAQWWYENAAVWLNCTNGQNFGFTWVGDIDTINDRWLPYIYSAGGYSLPLMRISGILPLPPGSTLSTITALVVQTAGGNLDPIAKWKRAHTPTLNINQCYGQFYSGYNVLTINKTNETVQWEFQMQYNGNSTAIRWRCDGIQFDGTGINPFL